MTGSDIVFWLSGIWDDLMNLDTADIPTLLFKLFILFVVSFFVWQIVRPLLRGFLEAIEPVFRFLWRVITLPFRLLWIIVRFLFVDPVRKWKTKRAYRLMHEAEAERERQRRVDEERRHAEAISEVRRILDVD